MSSFAAKAGEGRRASTATVFDYGNADPSARVGLLIEWRAGYLGL